MIVMVPMFNPQDINLLFLFNNVCVSNSLNFFGTCISYVLFPKLRDCVTFILSLYAA